MSKLYICDFDISKFYIIYIYIYVRKYVRTYTLIPKLYDCTKERTLWQFINNRDLILSLYGDGRRKKNQKQRKTQKPCPPPLHLLATECGSLLAT